MAEAARPSTDSSIGPGSRERARCMSFLNIATHGGQAHRLIGERGGGFRMGRTGYSAWTERARDAFGCCPPDAPQRARSRSMSGPDPGRSLDEAPAKGLGHGGGAVRCPQLL